MKVFAPKIFGNIMHHDRTKSNFKESFDLEKNFQAI
jgi:hypothetical protein